MDTGILFSDLCLALSLRGLFDSSILWCFFSSSHRLDSGTLTFWPGLIPGHNKYAEIDDGFCTGFMAGRISLEKGDGLTEHRQLLLLFYPENSISS